MGLFWKVGYEEVFLVDFLIVMGFSKGFFYKVFKDK